MKVKQILFIIIGILLLFACNNEDSVESINYEDSTYGVVGRWYAEMNSDNPTFSMFGEYVFTGDGAIYADEYRKINGYRRSELRGTYSVNNKNITIEFGINEGGRNTSPLKVTEGLTFSASFHRFSEDYSLIFYRIVGEIILTVDSTLNVRTDVQQSIEAYTAQQVEIKDFKMLDDAIASVDEGSFIIGKQIGVTFLKVETSVGTAVLKISVSDNKNLWNDYSKVLGKSFNEVKKLLGKHNVPVGDSLIRYYYDNLYIDSVDIYRHENIVDSIVVSFSENVAKDSIVSYLKRKQMIAVDSISDWYTNNKNVLLATISACYYSEDEARKLIYTSYDPNWDDRICDYRLSYDDLKNKYGRAKIYKDNQAYYDVKNAFVTQISYFFDSEGEVESYSFYVNMDIPQSMIVEFLDKRFLYKNSNRPYVRNFQYKGKEMMNYVSISDGNHHHLHYMFEENK